MTPKQLSDGLEGTLVALIVALIVTPFLLIASLFKGDE